MATRTDTDRLRFYLGEGKDNATPQRVLAQACGFFTAKGKPNDRHVRRVIKRLRAEGVPVVSDDAGSYIATDESEVARYKAMRFAHVRAAVEACSAVSKGWESEIANELFVTCRNCGAIISREYTYCPEPKGKCRTEFHSRAREAGYAMMGGAA